LFLNVQRGIHYGLLGDRPGDHVGGMIRNNIFHRSASQEGDVAIGVFNSANTHVFHNTVLLNGTYSNAIEYRFAGSTGLRIENNLTDAAIRQRDGATATLLGNMTSPRPEWFVNAAQGDLHLVAGSPPIDAAKSNVVSDDFDRQSRPSGAAADVGADEFITKKSNRAPKLNKSYQVSLSPIAIDNRNSWGTPVWVLTAGITDEDEGARRGLAVYAANAQNGAWQYTLDGGSTWRWVGGVSASGARLLPTDGNMSRVRFIPNSGFIGTATISYFAWDRTEGSAGGLRDVTLANRGGETAFSLDGRSSEIVVDRLNSAPVLNGSTSPSLTSLQEDNRASWGTPVWMIASGISDRDPEDIRGLAISSASMANGSWQYTLNGGASWQPLGAVTASAARLIPSIGNETRVRFVPNQDFFGTASLGYFAWDGTQGMAGGLANISLDVSRGGTTAYSVNWRQSTIDVTPVNDAPVVTAGGSVGYTLNASPITLASPASVRDVDSTHFGGGFLRLLVTSGIDSGNRLAIGGAFSLVRVDGTLRVVHNGVQIGTLHNDGVGTRALRVNFNERATVEVAQQLLRSITFRTVSSTSTAPRVVSIDLHDGQTNGLSLVATRTVNVTA
jgi:hypothetical protein